MYRSICPTTASLARPFFSSTTSNVLSSLLIARISIGPVSVGNCWPTRSPSCSYMLKSRLSSVPFQFCIRKSSRCFSSANVAGSSIVASVAAPGGQAKVTVHLQFLWGRRPVDHSAFLHYVRHRSSFNASRALASSTPCIQAHSIQQSCNSIPPRVGYCMGGEYPLLMRDSVPPLFHSSRHLLLRA